ncbi:keratinocyte-associated transmembrane protein 2-like isoform X2 [Amblyraja radiata]|uniref:keratinocyte-associated transmembrane protein 2-like isoform X2 n=1 Tax=Amblyraja radiata TaxID=386614 RepID=UPI001402D421|nr:keratinocyte-associated transmembrane protein 2-like isoform X2 [Amblyraja radiata]
MANIGFGLCLIFFGVTSCMETPPLNKTLVADNDTPGNENISLPIMSSTGNASSTENKQLSTTTKKIFDLNVQQNGSAPDLQFTSRKITTSVTSQSNGPVPQSTIVYKPDENMTSTTVNDGASVTQPTGSELTSKSSGPVPHPTTANKPGKEITTAMPTAVNNGASVTQPTGSELPSQTAIVKQAVDGSLTSKVKANVTKPSALNIDTTAKKFLQSDKKVAAKPAVDDGHFIIYLILGSLLVSLVYITYHNKNKIISLCRRGGPRRTGRPNASEYQRLDQNLSEVMTILKKKTSLKMN